MLQWFNARRAAEIGVSLADQYASRSMEPIATASRIRKSPPQKPADALRDFLQRAEREVRAVPLNFYKKAKLANAFKWRLQENGVSSDAASEVTRTLVMHLSMNRLTAATTVTTSIADANPGAAVPTSARHAKDSLAKGDQSLKSGAHAEAIQAYREFLAFKPNHVRALNNLGAAHWKLGQIRPAEECFRRALRARPNDPDAHSNLGGILRIRGHLTASENSLRGALKLSPNHVEARASLALTLLTLGRSSEAKPHLQKVLKIAPNNHGALVCMATIAARDGEFAEAEEILQRILRSDSQSSIAWATLVSIRKMTSADGAWLTRAEALVSGAKAPSEEADLRFAIGKYCDDVGDFARAFQNYKRANEITKANAPPYDRIGRTHFVDRLLHSHSRERVGASGTSETLDDAQMSIRPVFVVGMPRSGTSLVEQIIASHPAAAGAGELGFWSELAKRHQAALLQAPLGSQLRRETAQAYLRELSRHSTDAIRVVDKAPANSDFLGVIHSIFPNARLLNLRRDPIDTCLSCYFQQFPAVMDYTMDLADLAHYYRSHERLMAHWRSALPPGALLDVPYAELVKDQYSWTRKIIDFIGLDWDERCLDFEKTDRTVSTASAWQVRQKIYKSSLERWRNYEAFLGPLLELRNSHVPAQLQQTDTLLGTP